MAVVGSGRCWRRRWWWPVRISLTFTTTTTTSTSVTPSSTIITSTHVLSSLPPHSYIFAAAVRGFAVFTSLLLLFLLCFNFFPNVIITCLLCICFCSLLSLVLQHLRVYLCVAPVNLCFTCCVTPVHLLVISNSIFLITSLLFYAVVTLHISSLLC